MAFDLGTGGLTSWRADPAPDEVCAAALVGSTIYVAAGYETDGSGDRAELAGFDVATGPRAPRPPSPLGGQVRFGPSVSETELAVTRYGRVLTVFRLE